VAITGSINPIKNHLIGDRPIRFAKEAVIKGILNSANNPNDINKAAPIITFFEYKFTNN
jgi:hypothetical protein